MPVILADGLAVDGQRAFVQTSRAEQLVHHGRKAPRLVIGFTEELSGRAGG